MTDTASRAGTTDLASIHISVADAKPIERPFLGTITMDQYEDGRVYNDNDTGVTWHLGVTRVGSEKPFHNWIPLKFNKEGGYNTNSGKFGRVLNSVREIFGAKDEEGHDREPGHGNLVGLTGWCVLRVLTFGTDSNGEPIGGTKPSLIFVKKASKEDIETAGAGATPGEASKTLSDDDIAAALDILDGRKPLEYQKLVMKADISAELKSGILQGEVAKALVAGGYATQDGNVIRRVQETAEVSA